MELDADDEQALEQIERLDPTTAKVLDRSALAEIEAAVADRRAADEQILAAVRAARADGAPWTAIAIALGVSHQAAMKRFRQ